MAESLSEQILSRIDQVAQNYHRLLLVVAPSGGGKTAALQAVGARTGAPLVNLNLELSRRLLDLSERQRALSLPTLLGSILNELQGEVLLLDNIELLFDPALRQDPLRLLQTLSRNRTLVVSWNGTIQDGHLIYAEPGHPEYQRRPAKELVIVPEEKAP